MLGEIKENSISLMERMDDIVWSINPNNDSLESLFLRIKAFASKLFDAKEVNYTIQIDEKIKQAQLSEIDDETLARSGGQDKLRWEYHPCSFTRQPGVDILTAVTRFSGWPVYGFTQAPLGRG